MPVSRSYCSSSCCCASDCSRAVECCFQLLHRPGLAVSWRQGSDRGLCGKKILPCFLVAICRDQDVAAFKQQEFLAIGAGQQGIKTHERGIKIDHARVSSSTA